MNEKRFANHDCKLFTLKRNSTYSISSFPRFLPNDFANFVDVNVKGTTPRVVNNTVKLGVYLPHFDRIGRYRISLDPFFILFSNEMFELLDRFGKWLLTFDDVIVYSTAWLGWFGGLRTWKKSSKFKKLRWSFCSKRDLEREKFYNFSHVSRDLK